MEIFTQKQIRGTNDNPVISAVQELKDELRIVSYLGRGRDIYMKFKMSGADVLVQMEFQNHHKSRGWTLANVVEFLDERGRTLTVVSGQKGLKPKGWRGYRVKRTEQIAHGMAQSAKYVRTTTYRNRSGRFVKEAVEDLVTVIAAYYGDKAAWAKLGKDLADQFGLFDIDEPEKGSGGGGGFIRDGKGLEILH